MSAPFLFLASLALGAAALGFMFATPHPSPGQGVEGAGLLFSAIFLFGASCAATEQRQ